MNPPSKCSYRSPLRAACGLVLAAGAAVTALAQSPEPTTFALLDRQLNEQSIELLSISADQIHFRDAAGQPQSIRTHDAAALLPAWWSPRTRPTDSFSASVVPVKKAPSTLGVIELVDGQRLGVRLATDASPDPDTLYWESSLFGRLNVRLDRVRRLRFSPVPATTAAPHASKDDVVVLQNGDRLVGLIDRIGPTVSIEIDGRVVDTPSRQVAQIDLVNPPRPPAGSRLWLTDGTVVDVAGFVPDAGASPPGSLSMLRVELLTHSWTRAPRLSLSPAPTDQPAPSAKSRDSTAPGKLSLSASKHPSPTPRAEQPADAPVGTIKPSQLAAFAPDVQSLFALAACTILRQAPAAGRPALPASEPVTLSWAGARFDVPAGLGIAGALSFPPLDAADIELPGPMTVEWDVPTGAVRLAGWAELPRECRTWGNCHLVLSLLKRDGSTSSPVPLFSAALTGDVPIAEFNLLLPSEPAGADPAAYVLRASLDAGERGPIQDRVLLRRVLFLRENQNNK
ncbi:MAG: hypothetical protein AB7G11_15505 [Phycisphaerales bacterium]